MLILFLSVAFATLYVERYETFPDYVNAKYFRPIVDVQAAALRDRISGAIGGLLSDTINAMLSGGVPSFNLAEGIIVDLRHNTVNYRVLRKIHGELYERNITFDCYIANAYIPFPEVDPYGTQPSEIKLKFSQ